jgi:hypothetical protein
MDIKMRTAGLKEYLGWKCGWVLIPNEYEMIMVWLPLYMPIKERIAKRAQTIGRIIKGFWSGFLPESRGLHWDRKSRYGQK